LITDHTLHVLEYGRMLKLFVDRAESASGRERAVALRPLDDFARLQEEQTLCHEAIALHQSAGGFPSAAHDDIRPILDAVRAPGAVLPMEDFLKVARVLRVIRVVKTGIEDSEAGEKLKDLASALTPSRDLENRITHAIGPSGEILDGASPLLGRLRRQALATREAIRQRLESFLRRLSLKMEGDGYVTLRGDRYVVPVPASERGRVQGIVHDQSASGHTFFVEPFAVVEENNALARCEAETREEERRILGELSEQVRSIAPAFAVGAEVLGRLDLYRAIGSLASDLGMILPDMCEDPQMLRMVKIRHPVMLEAAEDREAIVPLDLAMGPDTRILILTGPNMGGKTVALKTIGINALLAVSGLPVLGRPGTTLPFLQTVAADIGDEQSMLDDLSTFAAHLRHLSEFIEKKRDPSLVLLDELGTGTDPGEGSALARAYLEVLEGPATRIVATTHLSSLKDFAAEHKTAANASMAFDEETLTPQFSLVFGVPGRSRAFDVASRLSFPRPVLDRAQSLLSREERRMDQLLADLESTRARVQEQERRLADAERQMAERLAEAERRREEAEKAFREAQSGAAKRAEEMLGDAEKVVKETRRELGRAHVTHKAVEQVGQRVREKRKKVAALREPAPQVGVDYPKVPVEEIKPGSELWSVDLGSVVTVDESPDARGMLHVLKGGIRFAVSVKQLRRAPRRDKPKKGGGVTTHMGDAESVSPELDLRGMYGDEAVRALERYLDSAVFGGLGLVRIIHGKGTGVLRRRVGEVLSAHSGVLKFKLGEHHEGGAGVTIAELGSR